jgi:hypothetical protein
MILSRGMILVLPAFAICPLVEKESHPARPTAAAAIAGKTSAH